MDDETPPPAERGMGDNNPPDTTPFELRPRETDSPELTAEKRRVLELIEAANAWIASVPEITTEEAAAACEDFITQLRAEYKAADELRKIEKAPHDRAAAAVQATYVPILDYLTKCGEVLKPLKAGWLDRVAERQRQARILAEAEALKAQQEAARLAAESAPTVEAMVARDQAAQRVEQAQRAAGTAAIAKPQVTGALTGRASGFRTHWSAEIVDIGKALLHYQHHPAVRAAVQQAADQDARTYKDALAVPGVKAKSERRV